MNRFKFFVRIPSMPQADRQMIQWAYLIAKNMHDGQSRDGGERYFEHVRRAALIMIQHGYVEAKYIVCLLLHDALEDTPLPVSILERLFGHEIARAILTVSKTYTIEDPLTGFCYRSEKRPKEEYFEGIQINGVIAALAKCADRIDNLTDLTHEQPEGSRWTPEKRLKQVEETREWILPIADMADPRFAAKLREQCAAIEADVRRTLAEKPSVVKACESQPGPAQACKAPVRTPRMAKKQASEPRKQASGKKKTASRKRK